MARALPPLAAILIMAAAGVANGVWNDRWGASRELEDQVNRLPKVPEVIGDWQGRDTTDTEVAERLIKNGTLHALVTRSYTNQRTKAGVGLLLATGRPGPISTHNPLTCINGVHGLTMAERPKAVTLKVDGGKAVFSYCDFNNNDPNENGLRVYWAWHDRDKGWVHSNNPRVDFARYRALTKIYVTKVLPPKNFRPTIETTNDIAQFIQDCLPTIDAVLFKNPGK